MGEKLRLPALTLVCIATRAHELACLAIADCLRHAEFGDLVLITDRPLEFAEFNHLRPQFKTVLDWPTKLGWSKSWWFDVPPLLRTSHTLNIQWDSAICDPTMWRDEFLEYDYVGAPWWHKDKNVGNGGFSLVSSRLKRYIYDRRADYPCDTDLDDDLLCRKYRPRLEEAGFRWAPEPLAHDFAFECCRPSPTSRHFGFHAMFNWPVVLDHETLLARLKIAFASPAIRDSFQMQVFCQKHPQIIAELKDIVNAEEGMSHASDQCLS